ncbi:MAG: carboxylesterase/lipase family protein [Phenylobacterium sp.]
MDWNLKTFLRAAAGPAAALATLVLGAAPAAAETGRTVNTRSGPVQATVRGDMLTWYAIPFAAPPVGDLRWRAPQPAATWKTPIAASKTAAPCLQTGPESPFRARAESEDCLYLDVHAPAGKGPYPVMVWIHGGAFTTGDASTYAEAGPLVSRGVIVVAIHYRLGAMGFLAHPALKWVRANISRFGGDARNVTLFGESAGGFSVLTHLASPVSKGLFDKAIIQSGGYGVAGQLTQAEMETKSALALKTAMAGQDLGTACKGEVMTAACLRSLPDAMVRGKLMTAYGREVGNLVPSVDGKVLPKTIQSIFADGGNHRVPVMNGSNEDENRLFLALNELGARFTAKPPNFDPADRSFLMTPAAYVAAAKAVEADQGVPAADLTERYYPLSRFGEDPVLQPSFAAAAAATDSTFSCNGINISARIAAQKSPVWMYEFRDQTAVPIVGAFGGRYVLSLPQGAAHAFELPYLFGMASAAQDAQHKALQATMSTYWTNFARSGDPNGPGVPAWEDFSKGSVQALDVASGGGVAPMSADAFRDQHLCRTAWSALTF